MTNSNLHECLFSSCLDINECENSNDCHMNATCANSIGSYSCACNNGFSGNGTICEGKLDDSGAIIVHMSKDVLHRKIAHFIATINTHGVLMLS